MISNPRPTPPPPFRFTQRKGKPSLITRKTLSSEVKKGPISISRKKLDVEAIRKAETGGPDYVPSFYRPPTVSLKKTMRFLYFRA